MDYTYMRETIATKQRVLEDEGLCRAVRQAGDRIIEAYRSGGSTYFCGNGGHRGGCCAYSV